MKRQRDSSPNPITASCSEPDSERYCSEIARRVVRSTSLADLREKEVALWLNSAMQWAKDGNDDVRLDIVSVLMTFPWHRSAPPNARVRSIEAFQATASVLLASPSLLLPTIECCLCPFLSLGCDNVPERMIIDLLLQAAAQHPTQVEQILSRIFGAFFPLPRWPCTSHHRAYVRILSHLVFASPPQDAWRQHKEALLQLLLEKLLSGDVSADATTIENVRVGAAELIKAIRNSHESNGACAASPFWVAPLLKHHLDRVERLRNPRYVQCIALMSFSALGPQYVENLIFKTLGLALPKSAGASPQDGGSPPAVEHATGRALSVDDRCNAMRHVGAICEACPSVGTCEGFFRKMTKWIGPLVANPTPDPPTLPLWRPVATLLDCTFVQCLELQRLHPLECSLGSCPDICRAGLKLMCSRLLKQSQAKLRRQQSFSPFSSPPPPLVAASAGAEHHSIAALTTAAAPPVDETLAQLEDIVRNDVVAGSPWCARGVYSKSMQLLMEQ